MVDPQKEKTWEECREEVATSQLNYNSYDARDFFFRCNRQMRNQQGKVG